MLNRIFLTFSLLAAGCQEAEFLVNEYAAEVQPPNFVMCGPSDVEGTTVYVSSLESERLDPTSLSDIAVIEAADGDYVIAMERLESGEIEGLMNVPFLNCEQRIDVVFLSGA